MTVSDMSERPRTKRTRPVRKSPAKYPKITFRCGDYSDRLKRLAEASHMSVGSIIMQCVRTHLPTIEERSRRAS